MVHGDIRRECYSLVIYIYVFLNFIIFYWQSYLIAIFTFVPILSLIFLFVHVLQVVKPAGDDIDGSYYTDNITRSATLPNNYGRQIPNGNTPINDTLKNATLQARLLPAYKTPEQGYIGNIENRRRIMSTPAYSRNRTHSQSSNYSQRYHSTNRVVSTHIPAHIDKRLVRSRSVGVIPDAELKMRKTASASVVKIDDCEDWIV